MGNYRKIIKRYIRNFLGTGKLNINLNINNGKQKDFFYMSLGSARQRFCAMRGCRPHLRFQDKTFKSNSQVKILQQTPMKSQQTYKEYSGNGYA